MQDFRKLNVWQKAHQLTLSLYEAKRRFPEEERYGLKSQMRRCAASVPANIAEGCGRSKSGDFARFLEIASGSASELEYHLVLARDLGYIDNSTHEHLTAEAIQVKQMLASLTQKVSRNR